MQRLAQQLAFATELDKLKNVLRQTLLTDASRQENTAEHSWHIALMAVVFAEYAAAPIQLDRVVRMLLVHDIVEIDAGDTFAFDVSANGNKAEREQRAAERIFALLPADQGSEYHALWKEFEAVSTPDAQYANAIDRLQPFLQNKCTEGGTWRIHAVARSRVMKRMEPVKLYLPKIWPEVLGFIDEACERGWIVRDKATSL